MSKSKMSKDNTEAADNDNMDAEPPDGTLVITKKRGVRVSVCVYLCVCVCVWLCDCLCVSVFVKKVRRTRSLLFLFA